MKWMKGVFRIPPNDTDEMHEYPEANVGADRSVIRESDIWTVVIDEPDQFVALQWRGPGVFLAVWCYRKESST